MHCHSYSRAPQLPLCSPGVAGEGRGVAVQLGRFISLGSFAALCSSSIAQAGTRRHATLLFQASQPVCPVLYLPRLGLAPAVSSSGRCRSAPAHASAGQAGRGAARSIGGQKCRVREERSRSGGPLLRLLLALPASSIAAAEPPSLLAQPSPADLPPLARSSSFTVSLRRQPFLFFGLPFLATVTCASFALSHFTQTRYDYRDHKVQSVSKEEELGMRKDRRKIDVREEYYVRLSLLPSLSSSLLLLDEDPH